jgi:hypothetical protein
MKFISALFKHALLAMQLEHDGSGLPTKFVSACLFVSVYVALIFANSANFSEELLGLSFIVFIYLFVLRTQIVALVILIGIISSFITFVIGFFGGLSLLQSVLLNAMEYLMVFGALINSIRRYANLS